MASDEARLSALEAREEIRQLAARYALAIDSRDEPLLLGLFTPDAEVVLPGGTGTVPPAGLLATVARYERTRHDVGQQVVDVDGGTATGVTYAVAHHIRRSQRTGELRNDVLVLRYRDSYARTPEGWRFARRELTIDWTEPGFVVRLE